MKRRKINKDKVINFGIKTMACFAIIMILYTGISTLKHKEGPPTVLDSTNHVSIDLLLDQHALALAGLKQLDGTDPATTFNISQVFDYIDVSRTRLEDEADKLGDEDRARQIDNLLRDESDLLSKYKADYESVKKLLAYVPAGDLVGSDGTVSDRANTAQKAINKFKTNNILSDKSVRLIDSIDTCLNTIKKKPNNKDAVASCDKQYHLLRGSVIADLNATDNQQKLSDISVSFSRL